MDKGLLVSLAVLVLACAGWNGQVSADKQSGLSHRRHILQASVAPPPPANATVGVNVTEAGNSTSVTSNSTDISSSDSAIGNSTVATNGTAPPPLAPAPSTPPPPETTKEKLHDKWEKLESGKSSAEKGVAITIGVIMLVSILTCLVCCVFRRGGQWRVPGLQWFKKKFGPKDKYSRYTSSTDDDGF